MFEKQHEPLAPWPVFLLRFLKCFMIGLGVICLGLAIGMLGYHYFEPEMTWIDAFSSAALVLSDQGPITHLQTNAGKIFVGIYALFSGLVFVSIVGVVFAPVLHRFCHAYNGK